MLTAKTIVNSIKDNYYDCDEIFLSGGGAYNKTLFLNIIENVEKIFPNKINVNTECQIAFAKALRKYFEAKKDLKDKGFDPRKVLADSSNAIKDTFVELTT